MGTFQTGPIKTLKAAIIGNYQYISSFSGIHMNYIHRSNFSGWMGGCGGNATLREFQYAFHDSIVDYLKTIDSEPQFCVKIVSSLPK